MQKLMNDTAELIMKVNNGDNLPVELNKLKEELSAVTYDDILNSTAPYEKILTLPDEFAISQQDKGKFPKQWDGTQVNEDVFCTELLAQHTLYCINGLFYDIDSEYLVTELSKVI